MEGKCPKKLILKNNDAGFLLEQGLTASFTERRDPLI